LEFADLVHAQGAVAPGAGSNRMSLTNRVAPEMESVSIPLIRLDATDRRDRTDAYWDWLANPDRRSLSIKQALREPLVHFMLAGAVLLALSSILGHSSAASTQTRIEVSAAEIDRLREIWIRQWGHPPDAKQMDNLVEDYVREEIYYREALASGLDKEDTIIRRRLVEKMEFLSQEVASAAPTEADLQQFFAANQQKYALPAQAGFAHIYFSTSRRGAAAFDDARAALAQLVSTKANPAEAAELGDSFMLQAEYPPQTREQIKDLFGDQFADAVLKLEPGVWSGPVKSTYGWHLVRITEYRAPGQASLDEVRGQVATDYKNWRLQTSSDNYYARLRQRYRVEVDQRALAAAKAKDDQPGAGQPGTSPASDGSPADLD